MANRRSSRVVVRRDASIMRQPATAEQLLAQEREDGYRKKVMDEATLDASFDRVAGRNINKAIGKNLQEAEASYSSGLRNHLQRVRGCKH